MKKVATFLILGFLASPAFGLQFNEIRISAASDDDVNNFFELIGSAGESLDGLSVLTISGEFEPGTIDFAFDLTGNSIPADGFFLASGDATFYGAATDFVTGSDFFGSPGTFALVDGFTGAAGDDLDTDNDGTFDSTPWSSIVDTVSLVDGDGNADVSYGTPIVGPDGDFAPAHIFRDEDGGGTFQIGLFGDSSGDTPGVANVPEPGAVASSLVGLLALVLVRRRW